MRYFVVGGEYADMSFTAPAAGTEVETHGPFATEREAKVCWRELTGKTVDNAMIRYFLKTADDDGGKNFWVVGGEYADSGFTRLAAGKELEVYGPFARSEAVGFWRGLAAKSIDDAMVRYDIRENYEAGETGGKLPASSKQPSTRATTKAIVLNAPVDAVTKFLVDGANWPRWAIHRLKEGRGSARLVLKSEPNGVLDYSIADEAVPSRVVKAGEGAVYIQTFVKTASVTEAQFDARMAEVDEELAALKRAVEA